MSLFLKGKDQHTTRVLCDLRPLNRLYNCTPPSFSLPRVHTVEEVAHQWTQVWFTKMDISAYFHSLMLDKADVPLLSPEGCNSPIFTFEYKGQCFEWLRLPFGWSWAPAIAQATMQAIVNESLRLYPQVLRLVYYDDVLLAAPQPDVLRQATQVCCLALEQNGLRISRHKCVFEPEQSVTWLGKVIKPFCVHNSTERMIKLADVTRTMANCRSHRTMRHIVGWLQWFASHHRGACRPLLPLYAQLHDPLLARASWRSLWGFATTMVLGCLPHHWRSPPEHGPALFVDAYAAGRGGGAAYTAGDGVTFEIPPVVFANNTADANGQQTAELFCCCTGIALKLLESQPEGGPILTDSLCCVHWLAGDRLPANRVQAQLLTAMCILRLAYNTVVPVIWVPSEVNLADTWSRARR